MHPFALLIKPVSADCNLNCDYCFYLPKADLYPETTHHRMSDELLAKLIQSYLACPQPVYSFIWQGGEPTLAGLDFFHKVTELQKQYGLKGARIANFLQTNATRITDRLAAHFGKYRFLVGCSLDGPAWIHNKYRRTAQKKPTHARVVDNIETLRRHRVPFNILTVVTRFSAEKAVEIYSYLKSRGYAHHQYIPCVEVDEGGQRRPFSVDSEAWGDFLSAIFDLWYARDQHTITVRTFESILSKMVGQGINACTMADACNQYFVVEYNGDIYPCDFYVEPQYKIGNILDTTWEAARHSKHYQNFAARKSDWNLACSRCRYREFCFGDCPRNRPVEPDGSRGLSLLCAGWKKFFAHTLERFQQLAATIKTRRRF